ncbi:hypothetical protein HWD94_14665 [Pseudarthrobacter equi]|nr:hypothetical protein [Pseudarthrobacter equi]
MPLVAFRYEGMSGKPWWSNHSRTDSSRNTAITQKKVSLRAGTVEVSGQIQSKAPPNSKFFYRGRNLGMRYVPRGPYFNRHQEEWTP